MATSTDWPTAIKPLLKKYDKLKHPLEYKNLYQLLVMVVLSARDSDRNINKLAPELFKVYPDMKSLGKATEADLYKHLSKVRGFRNKVKWLMDIASAVKTDKNIPLTMDELVKLPGIGRKSANVIMREAKVPAEGIMVDLHVVRVAPRLGITRSTDPKKIEADLMAALPKKTWGDAGMAMSHLGREVCRPTHPQHHECVMTAYCEYYRKNAAKTLKSAPPKAAPVKKKKKL
jgi:endonuclease III